jgi:signal transduction histidine kinase
MKYFHQILLSAMMLVAGSYNYAQPAADVAALLASSQQDTNQVNRLIDLSEEYYFSKPDSCFLLANKAIELARKINYTSGELMGLNHAGEALRFLGDFPKALEMQFAALQINRQMGDKSGEAATLSFIGFIYAELAEYRQGLNYLTEAKKTYDHLTDPVMISFNLSNIGNAYEGLKMLDSALFFQQEAEKISAPTGIGNLKVVIATRLGIIYTDLGNRELALQYFQRALQTTNLINDNVNPSKIQQQIAESYLAINQVDSSLYYARLAFANGEYISQKLQILDASGLLVKLFRKNNMPDSVIHYQDIAIAMKDSLFGPIKFRQLQLLALKDQEQKQEILQQQEKYRNKIKMFALLAILTVFLLIAIILYRNNRQKQKVNLLLQEQKNEMQQTLTVLKSTQAQLIQSEKMASLGELTAGIAHEIQNPLNFVNNFSEVNTELIDELEQEVGKGNISEVKSIAKDIRENELKINHHGKRADAIVKGMLQHSRTSSGAKELTDINALAGEYLRLSYNGLRAKDNSFNATLDTDFDAGIDKINIIPQDISRVLLNLYNNAFYAVNEKSKQQIEGYEPNVSVSTKKINDKVVLTVMDNGSGIPQKVIDKIFQPFFTTKPTGQGTGLGLSLSYDIVKAHGGEIKVETKENEGSEFNIELPLK